MAQTATLTFLGASGTVTGSKYLLNLDGRRVLLDVGMFQGEKVWRDLNWAEFPVDPATISDVVLTHAHTDHVAYLPALVRRGFRGPVWATRGSIRLAEIVLRDAGRLQEMETEQARAGGYSKHEDPQPLFTSEDVEATLPLFRAVDFDVDVDLGEGLVARWTRAGHILGSASVNVRHGEAHVLLSGDLGRHDHPILKGRDVPPAAPFVLMESTYGDREHPEPEVPHADFADVITRTVARGGQVVVPAFAIDRTETVLMALSEMFRAGRIPDVPVFVDGPMALSALDVYRDTSLGELRDDVSVADFLGMPRIRETRNGEESRKINSYRGPAIIISSSGMAEGGRVLHHLKRLLPDKRNAVVLTGYQAEGTRGRDLEEGASHVKIHGKHIPVRAEVVRDREFSVHGDSSDLVDWLRDVHRDQKPEAVYLVHGERSAQASLQQRIHDELGFLPVLPRHGEVISIIPGTPNPDDLDLSGPEDLPGTSYHV
ncbi:MBL fold metallo-hydrolase RNA specificity domain-containing protein [Propionibacteriaceae bacterium Y1923]